MLWKEGHILGFIFAIRGRVSLLWEEGHVLGFIFAIGRRVSLLLGGGSFRILRFTLAMKRRVSLLLKEGSLLRILGFIFVLRGGSVRSWEEGSFCTEDSWIYVSRDRRVSICKEHPLIHMVLSTVGRVVVIIYYTEHPLIHILKDKEGGSDLCREHP